MRFPMRSLSASTLAGVPRSRLAFLIQTDTFIGIVLTEFSP
jgi:hypothetical protein